jgi:hypothetical protein
MIKKDLHNLRVLKRSVQILFNLIMLGNSLAELGAGGAEIQLAPGAGAVIMNSLRFSSELNKLYRKK